jgi:micrococcal nuclease
MNIFLETTDELDRHSIDTKKFDFNGEVHLAKVIRCYDGDSIHCIFKHNGKYQQFAIRLYGYDSPEIRVSRKIKGEERAQLKKKGLDAKNRLSELILNKNVIIHCKKFDKYGRILGIIKLDDEVINDIMVNEGYGYEYYGKSKKK